MYHANLKPQPPYKPKPAAAKNSKLGVRPRKPDATRTKTHQNLRNPDALHKLNKKNGDDPPAKNRKKQQEIQPNSKMLRKVSKHDFYTFCKFQFRENTRRKNIPWSICFGQKNTYSLYMRLLWVLLRESGCQNSSTARPGQAPPSHRPRTFLSSGTDTSPNPS